MKAIDRNISRHKNGTLYFVTRRNGHLVRHSLRTKNLEEAKRQIGTLLATSLSAAREPMVPLLEGFHSRQADARATVPNTLAATPPPPSVPPISLAAALDTHDRGLVLKSNGAREMAARGRKAVETYSSGWTEFSPVYIWKEYRASGLERFGRELGSACNHLLWYLRKFVPWAISRGYLPEATREELGRLKKLQTPSRQIRVPSVAAVDELLRMVSSEDEQGGDFLRFLASTGLRLRGATGLTWGDIHFVSKQMVVRQKGGRKKVIPLTPEALELLEKRKAQTQSKPFGLDQKAIEVLERRMKRFAKGLDLDLTFFHAFRHYFASKCLMAGLTVQEVAELLGHSDGGVLVLKTYGHICSDHLRNAVARLQLAKAA